MYRGVGVVDYTPTGVRFAATPTCLFPDEKEAANLICWAYTVDQQQSQTPTVIRGVGQQLYPDPLPQRSSGTTVSPYMPPGSRFEGRLACSIKDLPLCPSEAQCMDDATAELVAGCIARSYVNDDHRQWCEGGLGPLFYATKPYCNPQALPPVSDCLDAESAAARDYCRANRWEGPDPGKNALCWLGMHHEPWWDQYDATPTCAEMSRPSEPVQTGPAPQPLQPGPTGPQPSEDRRTAAMGIFGLLGLVAVAGGGYYLYQRRKK